MGKRKKKNRSVSDAVLKENEVIIYGSANGWLRVRDHEGEEYTLIPEFQTEKDEPANFVFVGKFYYKEEQEETDAPKTE